MSKKNQTNFEGKTQSKFIPPGAQFLHHKKLAMESNWQWPGLVMAEVGAYGGNWWHRYFYFIIGELSVMFQGFKYSKCREGE